jgi:hypothetical protein
MADQVVGQLAELPADDDGARQLRQGIALGVLVVHDSDEVVEADGRRRHSSTVR